MRKLFVAALFVVMTLSLSLIPAFAEAAVDGASRRDIPLDSDEFKALQHEVYEANQLSALLERHESVTFDMSDAPKNDYDWRDYWYITRDACYYESPSTTQYETDRRFYTLTDPDAGAQLMYGLDLCSDYDLWTVAGYQFPPKDEADWSNSELEEHDACYVENGLLVLRDRRNPEASEAWFAEHVPYETYDGETVYTEVIADAETKEIIEFNDYLEDRDGAMRRAVHHTAAYDEPQPRRVRNMLAAIEHYCEHVVTVTFVVDSGYDHERSGSLTMPVGGVAVYRCDHSESAIICDDPEANSVTHYDGMQDRTFYIITEPSEAQVERYQAQVQAIREALAAEAADAEADTESAEPDAETFKALVAANTGSAILSRHASFEATRVTFRDGEAVQTETNYRDADTYFWDYGDGQATLYLDDLCVARKTADQGFMYVETICDTEEAVRDLLGYALDSAVVFLPEEETLLETVDADDGQFVAVTQLNDPDCVAQQLTETAYASGYEYAEGMIMRFQYTFDIQTTDLLEFETTLIDTEGEAHLLQRNSVAYDVQDYDPFAEGEPFAEYEAAAKDPEQSRTITVVFDPDTENERGVGYVLPQNAGFSIFLNGEYVKQPYIDRECTQPFEGSDGVSDLMLYVK